VHVQVAQLHNVILWINRLFFDVYFLKGMIKLWKTVNIDIRRGEGGGGGARVAPFLSKPWFVS
jgi:hypothetical protein